MSFNFMAAVTTCSDFGAQEIKSVTVSIVSPPICHDGTGCQILVFLINLFILIGGFYFTIL